MALCRRAPGLAVVLDNEVVARELSIAGARHGVDVRFLVECDTGFGRTGVQTPAAAFDLARLAARLPRMQFRGLMTFPNREPTTREFFERALALFKGAGMPVPVVSGGGTPALFTAQNIPMLTEHRAGTCVFNDVMVVSSGTATWDNCAMRVRATVVSRPTDGRAILDCGTKVLTSDPRQRVSQIMERDVIKFPTQAPDKEVAAAFERYNLVSAPVVDENNRLLGRITVDDVVDVIRMVDELYGVRGEAVEVVWPVAARGRVR